MAIAAPKRSGLQSAPASSRTAPPEPKKRPRDRPRPGGSGRSSAAAPEALRKEGAPKRKAAGRAAATPTKRKGGTGPLAPKRKAASRAAAATDSPIRKTSSKRKKATSARAATAAPARKPSRKSGLVTAPSRHKAAPRRRARVLPYAAGTAGRAAVAVTQLPESGLIHRLTRGRLWIGLLGVLLVGIVALNVVTLSFAASLGKIEAVNTELSKENSMLQSRASTANGQEKMRNAAAKLGLALPTEADAQPQLITARKSDVGEAAARLRAAAAANPE